MTKRITCDERRILSITPAGIRCLDNEGEEVFIDFRECRTNWVWFVIESDIWPHVTQLNEEDSTCVACRDAFDHPAYFEFFTEPRTRIEFHKSRSPVVWWFM